MHQTTNPSRREGMVQTQGATGLGNARSEANKRDIEEVTPKVPVSVPLRLELKQGSNFAVLGDNPGQNDELRIIS